MLLLTITCYIKKTKIILCFTLFKQKGSNGVLYITKITDEYKQKVSSPSIT